MHATVPFANAMQFSRYDVYLYSVSSQSRRRIFRKIICLEIPQVLGIFLLRGNEASDVRDGAEFRLAMRHRGMQGGDETCRSI